MKSLAVALLLASLAPNPSLASESDTLPPPPEIELVVIDAALESAVVLWRDELRLVQLGDELLGDREAAPLEVVDVSGDRVVLERTARKPRPHRQRLWLRFDDGGRTETVELYDPAVFAPEPVSEPQLVFVARPETGTTSEELEEDAP